MSMRTLLLLSLVLVGCALDTTPNQPNTSNTTEEPTASLGAVSHRGGTPCAPVFEVSSGGRLVVKEWLCQASILDWKTDPARPAEQQAILPADPGPETPNLVKGGPTPPGITK